ncbi:MAG: hypothetical protein Q4C78_04310 [Synergistaceae bacterium]|nr:hypothetical protein [Synergistaceae bacterium]
MGNDVKLFEGQQIRSLWDKQQEKWYFSVIDILGVLTESENPRKYWSVLKTRLKKEGNELATICSQLKQKAKQELKTLANKSIKTVADNLSATEKICFKIIQTFFCIVKRQNALIVRIKRGKIAENFKKIKENGLGARTYGTRRRSLY